MVVQRGSIESEHVDRETEKERKREREKWAHYHVHAAFKIKKSLYGRSCLGPDGFY